MGTLAYMSPEQTRDTQGVKISSDIYTLGVILYETLTGRRPFLGKQSEVFRKICNESPAPPSTHRPGLDPRLDAICLKAMAKQPEDRFSSMAEFAAEMGKLLDEKPLPPPKPVRPAPARAEGWRSPRRRSSSRWGPRTTISGRPWGRPGRSKASIPSPSKATSRSARTLPGRKRPHPRSTRLRP